MRLALVDPKLVELGMFDGIPHLLSPVVKEIEKVVPLLKNAVDEMERRYRLFSALGVTDLESYGKLRREKRAQGDTSIENLPIILIVIDELADLMDMAPEETEKLIKAPRPESSCNWYFTCSGDTATFSRCHHWYNQPTCPPALPSW